MGRLFSFDCPALAGGAEVAELLFLPLESLRTSRKELIVKDETRRGCFVLLAAFPTQSCFHEKRGGTPQETTIYLRD